MADLVPFDFSEPDLAVSHCRHSKDLEIEKYCNPIPYLRLTNIALPAALHRYPIAAPASYVALHVISFAYPHILRLRVGKRIFACSWAVRTACTFVLSQGFHGKPSQATITRSADACRRSETCTSARACAARVGRNFSCDDRDCHRATLPCPVAAVAAFFVPSYSQNLSIITKHDQAMQ